MPIESHFRSLYLRLSVKFLPNIRRELENAIAPCKTILDVGCGSNSLIQYFSNKYHSIGVDAFQPSIKKSRMKGIHNDYYQMDVLDISEKFSENSFDCVIALDLIEHLTKKEGNKLLEMMEKISKLKTIIITPNGFLPQSPYENNPWQLHKSGWSVKEMEKKGYQVIGINGWKLLKDECAIPRYKPRLLWYFIAEISQIFVKKHPEKAFQIMCVKEKKIKSKQF